MFLRATKRFKDGKVHYYWSMVENVRVGRRVFQRKALYLGELNDSQRSEWQRAVEAFGHPPYERVCVIISKPAPGACPHMVAPGGSHAFNTPIT